MKTLSIAVVATLALVGRAGGGGQSADGNAAAGGQLFQKYNCYYCHGTAGQGGRDGARIAALSLNAQAFKRYVRQPAAAMPAFTDKVLSDEQLTNIYAYLKTLPAAKDPKDIPLLDQVRAK